MRVAPLNGVLGVQKIRKGKHIVHRGIFIGNCLPCFIIQYRQAIRE